MMQRPNYLQTLPTTAYPTSYVTSAPVPSINSSYSPLYQQYASGYPEYQSPIYRDHNQYRLAPTASHQYPLIPSNQPISHPAYVTSGYPYHTSAYAGYPYIQGLQQPRPSEKRKSYIPYKRKYIDYENQVIRVPVERVRMGYYDQITEIQYVPKPVQTIVMETVPVQRETQKIMYIPVQKKIVHLPEHFKEIPSQMQTIGQKIQQKTVISNPSPPIQHRLPVQQNKIKQAFKITFGQPLNKNSSSNQSSNVGSLINKIPENRKIQQTFEVRRSSFQHGEVKTSGNFQQSRVREVPNLKNTDFKIQNLMENGANRQKYE